MLVRRRSRVNVAVTLARVGPYEIVGMLGSGAMGVVHDALTPDGRRIALKVMHRSQTSADLQRRFEQEANIRIVHPNVVEVHEAGVADGTLYIALERLEGEPLSARIARGVLPAKEARAIAVQALFGLESAHAAGLVHRDVKPANARISFSGASER
jgi:eukaryotic-like serine/threonine-protein kinase